jgi:hypothetical protein
VNPFSIEENSGEPMSTAKPPPARKPRIAFENFDVYSDEVYNGMTKVIRDMRPFEGPITSHIINVAVATAMQMCAEYPITGPQRKMVVMCAYDKVSGEEAQERHNNLMMDSRGFVQDNIDMNHAIATGVYRVHQAHQAVKATASCLGFIAKLLARKKSAPGPTDHQRLV